MTNTIQTVLIVGATGSIGRPVIADPYTIVRPGWFDYNDADQHRIVMLQGDAHQSGSPADGVIARDQIARVLIDSLHTGAARSKTFELSAEHGTEQANLDPIFDVLDPDQTGQLNGIKDHVAWNLATEPTQFRSDLNEIGS